MFWLKFRWVLLVLLISDLFYLNFKILISSNVPPPAPQIVNFSPTPIIPTPTQVIVVDTPVPRQIKKNKSVAYLPVPGNGLSSANVWENLSGTEFYFDTADYPNLKDAYLEANMKLLNGNGTAFLRLFDITAGIEVWGSEIKSQSQSAAMIVSGKLTLRPGNHQYRVQAKSLTADTAVFTSGRIKLISEN